MHLFSNARYFLGCEVLEYFENAGIITTIHNYLTKSRNYSGIVGSGYLTAERLLLMQLMNPGELEIYLLILKRLLEFGISVLYYLLMQYLASVMITRRLFMERSMKYRFTDT